MGQQQSKSQEQLVIPKPGIIIPKSTKQAMTDTKLGYVYLGGGRWKAYEVGLYAPYVQQWNVQKGLVLDTNYEPYIFTQIIDIKFANLLQLSLRQNHIESIEILCKLNAPRLQKLFMCQNNISSIRSIRRFYAPNLIYLSFNGNQNLQTMNFAYLDSQVLQQLFIHLKEGISQFLNFQAHLYIQIIQLSQNLKIFTKFVISDIIDKQGLESIIRINKINVLKLLLKNIRKWK